MKTSYSNKKPNGNQIANGQAVKFMKSAVSAAFKAGNFHKVSSFSNEVTPEEYAAMVANSQRGTMRQQSESTIYSTDNMASVHDVHARKSIKMAIRRVANNGTEVLQYDVQDIMPAVQAAGFKQSTKMRNSWTAAGFDFSDSAQVETIVNSIISTASRTVVGVKDIKKNMVIQTAAAALIDYTIYMNMVSEFPTITESRKFEALYMAAKDKMQFILAYAHVHNISFYKDAYEGMNYAVVKDAAGNDTEHIMRFFDLGFSNNSAMRMAELVFDAFIEGSDIIQSHERQVGKEGNINTMVFINQSMMQDVIAAHAANMVGRATSMLFINRAIPEVNLEMTMGSGSIADFRNSEVCVVGGEYNSDRGDTSVIVAAINNNNKVAYEVDQVVYNNVARWEEMFSSEPEAELPSDEELGWDFSEDDE